MPEIEAGISSGELREPLGVLPAGTRLRIYELVSVLGQGGFGITYLARDTKLDREVAIKEYLPTSLALRHNGTTVMPRSTELSEDFVWGRERFLDEARTLARLEGAPAVVRVIDFLEDNGTAYTVMALARGETLDRRLRREGTLQMPTVQRLLDPLLDGLERVHAAGFLHRDIKPANIIVDERGAPTLIDFGASRAAMVGRSTALTAIFTPGYAAAEQFTSSQQGPPTDIYGLSATLYHAITGRPPPSAIDRILDDTYQPLASLRLADFAPELLGGIDAGLAVRVSQRPQSIDDWRRVFREGPSAVEPEATQVIPRASAAAQPARRSTERSADRRRRLLWAGAAAALVALLASGTYLVATDRIAIFGKPVQSLTAEELQKALEERRQADALAAEKKKLEEEAAKQAAADAEAKRKADEDLAAAQSQRQRAEEELAKLRADLEARKKAAEESRQKAAAEAQRVLDEATQKNKAEAEMAALRKADEEARQKAAAEAAAQQAAAEEAQRKAEADAAAARAAEEAAAKKAAADAEAKRLADEALAKAQAEREKAEVEAAKQQATLEAKQKAEADAKAKVEVEAKAAAEKKAAEAAENGLKLATLDRQHLQVALTSLGFDTRGSDGAFGPRSREMITAWQKAHKLPETGFLNATQQQALLKEGATAVQKYDDDEKKKEEDKKKADEDAKKKAEEEAKAKSPSAATPATPVPGAGFDGTWSGKIGAWSVGLTVNGSKGTLRIECEGAASFNVKVGSQGQIAEWINAPLGGTGGAVPGTTRQQVTGTLPNFTIPVGTPACKGGSGTLSKASP